ncbi:MAG: hypothetical protein ATN36_02825 [Epulopiscium sp. Nele67-Bin005]|nr:MAG: hypothetical protein ATN36_02825 [Epulopiscium sp. Nele67-Bin005]
MLHKTIYLNEIFSSLDTATTCPTLDIYMQNRSAKIDANRKRPCIIICPGGSYMYTSDREAEPVAMHFLAHGFNACVLRYSTLPNQFPRQLLELSATIAHIRRNSDEWGVEPEQIVVLGFSAGGHLAGSIGVHWDKDFATEGLELLPEENKPNKLVLCYPLISTDPNLYALPAQAQMLVKTFSPLNFEQEISLENHVSENTPPTFLWHTLDDVIVNVENSFKFALALRKNNVPLEMHIYPQGVHGLSLATTQTTHENNLDLIDEHINSWADLASEWIKRY